MCWFRAWIPVWEQLSPAQPWLQARRCTPVALRRVRMPAATLSTCSTSLGQGATFSKNLSLIRHPWFTLLTASLTLSGVCVESKFKYCKFKLECRRQFYEGVWISLHPVESPCWSAKMCEEKGEQQRGAVMGWPQPPPFPIPCIPRRGQSCERSAETDPGRKAKGRGKVFLCLLLTILIYF